MRTLLDTVAQLKSRSIQKRSRHFSLIDFGTDTIKAAVVRKEKAGVRVLGYGFAPAEGRLLSSRRAEVVTLAALVDAALVSAEDQTKTGDQPKVVPDEALVCIPARFARGECFSVQQNRSDPTLPITLRELNSAWERIERLARERLPHLGDENAKWKPLAHTPGVITVDGHYVTDPVGLKGGELALAAFGTAIWPAALEAATAIAERLELTIMDVMATPQALANVVPQRDAIVIDVGAQGTSVQLIQHEALIAANWWSQGGEFFTESLSKTFRCSRDEAEALKRAYADDALSTSDTDLVRRALNKPVAMWLETLVESLHHIAVAELIPEPMNGSLQPHRTDRLPGRMYLTGGASLLPDVTRALRSLEATPALSFRRSLEIMALGSSLGVRAPARMTLLDMPPYPLSELLAPAISLVACLE
jgi:cell division ATPase FtsA